MANASGNGIASAYGSGASALGSATPMMPASGGSTITGGEGPATAEAAARVDRSDGGAV